MDIATIIAKHYDTLKKMLKDTDRIVSQCKTDEDHLQDICMMAMKTQKNKNLTEQEGFDYLKKSLLMTLHFKNKKIDKTVQYFADLPQTIQFPDIEPDSHVY